jgi:hypothetical protein
MLTLILGMGCQQPSGQSLVTPDVLDSGASDSQDTALPKDTEKDTSSPKDSGDTDSGDTDSGDTDTAPELEPAGDYSTSGTFSAGQHWGEVTGTSGSQLYISSWYPSSATTGDSTWYGWGTWWNEGDSLSDVAAACDEPRPVIVHSHGNLSLSWEMYWLPEFLATHGWISVAPDHEGNTAYDNSASFEALYLRRPQDIQDTFNWLVAQSEDPASILYGCVDESAGYVVSGYSFGGYTAYATGGGLINAPDAPASIDLSDDRVTGVMTYVPWNAYGAMSEGTASIDVPVLTIGGRMDETVGTDYLDLHDPITATPRLLGDFEDVGHLSFCPIYCWSPGDGCGPGNYDQDDFISLTRTTVLSWIEHIRGRPGAIEQIPEQDGAWTLVE